MLVSQSWAKLLKSLKSSMPSPLPTICLCKGCARFKHGSKPWLSGKQRKVANNPGLLDFESTKTSRLKGMLELGGLLVEAQIRKWGDPKHKQQSCMSFRVVLLQVRGLKREVF